MRSASCTLGKARQGNRFRSSSCHQIVILPGVSATHFFCCTGSRISVETGLLKDMDSEPWVDTKNPPAFPPWCRCAVYKNRARCLFSESWFSPQITTLKTKQSTFPDPNQMSQPPHLAPRDEKWPYSSFTLIGRLYLRSFLFLRSWPTGHD